MTNNENIVDQEKLATSVSDNIKFEFFDYFLVKPLDPIKVTKSFSKPVKKSEAEADSNGIVAAEYEDVETEVKEVNSDYRTGIVIKTPTYYKQSESNDIDIKIGDKVVFRDAAGSWFDLVKDSRLLRRYDILAVVK